MYTYYTLFILMGLTISSFGQNNFTKYENMDDVSSMVMDRSMFRLLSQMDFNGTDQETRAYLELVENIENIKVFSSEKNTTRQTMKADIETYLRTSTLKELLTSNEDGQKVQLYTKPSENPNHVSELVIFLEETTTSDVHNTVIVFITGNINLKQVFKLTKDLDIPGSNALKKLSN